MEQQLPAGLGEGEIAEFVEDQEVEAGYQLGHAALTVGAGFGVELVHQIHGVEEAAPFTGPDTGPRDGDGEMRLSGSRTADQDEVALVIKEVSGGQITDQGLVDLRCVEVELVDLLGMRQLGDGHLVLD